MTQFERKLLLAAAALAIVLGMAHAPQGRAQTQSTATLAFEVASIRPAAPQEGGKMLIGFGNDPGRFTATNVTVKELMTRAFEVRRHQISGPSWLDSDRFDVVAKLPEGATRDQVPAMAQNMLVERFKLELRREKKETSVYALVVAKSGAKLQKSAEGELEAGKRPGLRISAGGPGGMAQLEANRVTLSRFADMLSNMMDRPIVDQTELEGNFDFAFEVSTEELRGMRLGPRHGPDGGAPADGPAPEGDPSGPSLHGALQKLGLKLEGRKLPIDTIVVVKGNRTPTEN